MRLRSSSAVGGRQVTTSSLVLFDAAGVGVLEKQAAGDLLDDGFRRGGVDLDQAEVPFAGEGFAGFGGKGRGRRWLRRRAWRSLRRPRRRLAVDADDAAEGRDGVGGEGFLIGLEDGGAGGCAAGVGVLDDGDGGQVGVGGLEFLGELPAGVEIDQVVEAQLFALELPGTGDAEAGAIGIEGGALVGVLAVAEGLGEVRG